MPDPYVATAAAPLEPRLCTVDAASKALGVSPRTCRRLISEGLLGSVKVGGRRLVPTAALDAFVETALAGDAA